ncbi:hypothetical protein AX15_002130 [Amanita polypyramis BW_CC]|nr:hypothetical protein AX15_002130 [Amanita polypyramis BW_CC]
MSSKDVSHSLEHLRNACSAYDINSELSISSLTDTLNTVSGELAQSRQRREDLGSSPALWSDLRKLWRDLASAQLTFWEDLDGSQTEDQSDRQIRLRTLCLSTARFTRNLVAGVPHNQEQAFENEPEIRRLLHYHTSWSATEDKQSMPVACMLAQTLSNLVTSNERLMMSLWELYTSLPEDQAILIRLLSFPDHRTILTALIFVMNCIRGSERRIKLLCRTTIGSRVCVTILDAMIRLYDADEDSDGGQAFDVGYGIISQLIEQGYVPDLYSKFAMADEPVTPHQTTLLKIVDSYLQSKLRRSGADMFEIHWILSPLLAKTFFSLSTYAQIAIDRSLGSSSPSLSFAVMTTWAERLSDTLPTELDTRLPKVCEALVLLTQCMVTISLAAEERRLQSPIQSPKSPTQAWTSLKDYFNAQQNDKQGVVESLIGLLRLLDLFLPRINFGRPVSSSPLSAEKTFLQNQSREAIGFSYLKRDLVRLLGILCHKERNVQDRIRNCGGIPVVMNLCVIDERNPYLREHAILVLHNLLDDNLENQRVVDSIKPINKDD